MGQTIELRDIPRGTLRQNLETAARQLPPDPGNYTGDCAMFRGADGFPVCLGQCGEATPCHLAIISTEGSHSDLYNYLVLCTCMSDAALDKLIGGRAKIVKTLRSEASGIGATPVGEGAAQCWTFAVKSEKIKAGEGQRTQLTVDPGGCVELVSEAIEDGQATFVVRCKKDKAGKCTDCHAVMTLWVSDKDGNIVAEKKAEITCRQI